MSNSSRRSRERSFSFDRVRHFFGRGRKSSDSSLSPGPERRRKCNSTSALRRTRRKGFIPQDDPELTEALESLFPAPSKKLVDRFYFSFLPHESPFHWYPLKLCVDFAGISGWQRLWVDKKLKNLDLRTVKLSDKGLVALSFALRSNVWIRKLSIPGGNFGDQGSFALCKALCQSNSSLVDLNLGNNPQLKTAEGLKNVCRLLKHASCPIKTLYLDKIDLSPEAVKNFCQSLKTNRSVKKLYLLGCNWTEKETIALSDVLSKNPRVQIFLPKGRIYKETLEPFLVREKVHLINKRSEAQRLRYYQ